MAILGCTAFVGAEREANAAGYLVARFGSDHGTPAMPNNFAMYFNPAAMSGMKGTQLTGDLSALLRFVSYTREQTALSPSAANSGLTGNQSYVNSNTGNNKIVNVLALPFLGISSDFGSKWFRAGYSLYVPFGGLAKWNQKDEVTGSPGSNDGPQRWHNISGQILTIYNTLAASVKIGDTGLAIGANFSPIIHNVSTVRARNLDGSDDTVGLGGELVEGRSLINAWSLNFGAAFGLYYASKDESARIGLSYTSQPGFGTTRISGTLKQTLGAGPEGESTKIDLLNAYPDIIRLGGAIRVHPKVEVRSDIEYARWSTFDKQCVVKRGTDCNLDQYGADKSGAAANVILNIPREFKDTVLWRMGPAWFVSDRTELFGSFGVGTPAVPKKTIDASTIDALTLYFTAGARVAVSKKVAVGVSYNHIYFATVNTNGESGQNRYRSPDANGKLTTPNVSTSPSADGTFNSTVAMLNANINYTF